MPIDLFHQAVDFSHAQVFSADDADQNGIGVAEHLSGFEQRMREKLFERLLRAVVARGLHTGERAFRVTPSSHGAEIVEIDVDQS